jgi:hypothetical protein
VVAEQHCVVGPLGVAVIELGQVELEQRMERGVGSSLGETNHPGATA